MKKPKKQTKAEAEAAEIAEKRYYNALTFAQYLVNKNKAAEVLAQYLIDDWSGEGGEKIMQYDIKTYNNLLEIEAS